MILQWAARFCLAALLLALSVAALAGVFLVLLMLVTVIAHH